MTIAYKHILLCMMLLVCGSLAQAQSDSANTRFKDDNIVYDTIKPSPQATDDIQKGMSNPGWYVVSQVARFFNVGVYYSYIIPTGTLKQEIPSKSAFSFDFGLDLTHLFGRNESYWHWILGLNADYASFGKSRNPRSFVSGDTTYSYSVSNTVAVYSYYIEVEYGKSYLTPFASIAATDVYFEPYKKKTTTIHNANINSTNTVGEELESFHARGMNFTAGLKYKYRFNEHKQLMLVTRVSYLLSEPVDMIDLSTAMFSPNGEISYQTKSVSPSWFMLSIGAKYNF